MDKRLTVVLTLKDRPSYTDFFLTHSVYDAYEYLVLDGGFGSENEEIFSKRTFPNLTYVRYQPDETYDHYLEKVRDGLTRVTTPYLVRIDNDDILLEPGTDRAVAALDADADAILAGGDLAGFFHEGPTSRRASLPFSLANTGDLDCPDVVQALVRNRLHYRPVWNSVMRSAPYREAWDIVADVYGIEAHLAEFAMTDLMLAKGRFLQQGIPHYLRLENQTVRGISSLTRVDHITIDSPEWWAHSDQLDDVIRSMPKVSGADLGTQAARIRLLQMGVQGTTKGAQRRILTHHRIGAVHFVPFSVTKSLASRGLVLPLPLYSPRNG